MQRQLLIALLTLGFALVLAVLVAVLLIDPNDYRDAIGERLTAASGRAVEIEGDLTLDFSWQPELRFGGLRVANAAWGSAPDMLWVEEAAAQVSLWPLLFGEVRIRRLTVDGMVLLLERHSDGRANWEFESGRSAPAPANEEPSRNARSLPEVLELQVRELAFRLRDAPSGRDEALRLHSLELRPAEAVGTTRVTFALDYRGAELSGTGTVGSLWALGARGDWPLDLDLQWGEASLALRGHVEVPELGSFDLMLLGEAPDLALLGHRFDLDLPTLPVTLHARLHGGLEQYRLEDLTLMLGASDLAGHFSAGVNLEQVGLHLRSRRLDLDAWRRSRLSAVQAAPLFSSSAWPRPLLPAISMPFSWEVENLSVGGFSLREFHLEGELRADRSVTATVNAIWAEGRLAGDVALIEQADGLGLLAEGRLTNASLGQLLQQARLARDIDVNVDATLQARASGRSAAELARSFDGYLSLVGGEGRIHHQALGALSSDLLGSLMPFMEEDDSAALNCLAGRFDFTEGVAEDAMVLFDSETVTLAGRGRVDLGGERVAMLLTPRPKRAGLMNFAVPMELVGPLRSPEVRPESGGLARRAAGVALAVVNPLVLLVPVVTTTFRGTDNPCLTAVEEARTGQPGAEPESRVEGFMRGLRRVIGGDG